MSPSEQKLAALKNEIIAMVSQANDPELLDGIHSQLSSTDDDPFTDIYHLGKRLRQSELQRDIDQGRKAIAEGKVYSDEEATDYLRNRRMGL